MYHEPHKEFRLRAFYPNYFAIRQILDEDIDHGIAYDSTGFPRPELEYINPKDHKVRYYH